MIAQMQKRARGISQVGRRLFPNLQVTALPPAWVQLLGDPITALDRCLASVTSVPIPDSEGNSTGTMSDSPPPHTFRWPQQSLASSQNAYDPAMAGIQRPGQGISRVGSRLFPDLGGTGLPPAWSQVPGDPITALGRSLASVTSVPIPDSEGNSTGTMSDGPPPHTFRQPQPSPMSSQNAYDPAMAGIQRPGQGQGISRVGSRLFPDLGPAWSQVPGDPISALDRRLASVTSVPTPDLEEDSTGTMSDSPPQHTFRQPQQSPVSSHIGYDPARAMIQRQGQGISRVGRRLFPDLGPAWSQVPDDPTTAVDRRLASATAHTPASETPTENPLDETAAPPDFFAFDTDASPLSAGLRQSASPAALPPADISPAFRSSGARIVGLGPPKPNLAAAGRSSSLAKDQSGRTKLVPFSRLAEILHSGGSADESRTDPHSLEATEAEPTAPAGSNLPSQAVTVEAVLEQLEQRLQFEFLRMYGSSGE